MKFFAIISAVFVSSTAAGDVLFERSFYMHVGRLHSVQDDNRFSKNIEFQWTIVDPIGSVSPDDRVPFLSFPITNTTKIGSSVEADTGWGFDIAASLFADERIETAFPFTNLRTNFFYESDEYAGNIDLSYTEGGFLSVPFGTTVSPLAGADIESFRATLLMHDVIVSDDATTTRIDVSYEVQLQILGIIPAPSSTAFVAMSAGTLIRRRRRH
jgi:hypothetical protein